MRLPPSVAAACLALAVPAAALAQSPAASQAALAREVLREIMAINTAPSGGEMSRANAVLADRLRAAGYAAADVQLAGPDDRHRNLVATLAGRDRAAAPLVLMAHIDVVEARADDWSVPPYALLERDGYFYGRGTTDNKGGVAVLVANMIRWKREGFRPARDVVAIVTTDEETSAEAGIQWLLANVPALRTAEFALNTDAGGLQQRPGEPPRFFLQSSEKMYQTFSFTVTNRGGHSSLPREDNAIYALARALARLEAFRFPVMYNEVTRESFARLGGVEQGAVAEDLRVLARGDTAGPALERLARDPAINGNLRTTCVATMLEGGHAENALPQKAAATVNCRIFPGVSADEVQETLERVVADTAVRIAPVGRSVASPASPLRPDVVRVVESTARAIWPGAVTVPVMENGATDGLFLRNVGVPVYGVSGPLFDIDDDRAHGRDERLLVRHFDEVVEFWYRMVTELASAGPRL